jgi:hypothetical protein
MYVRVCLWFKMELIGSTWGGARLSLRSQYCRDVMRSKCFAQLLCFSLLLPSGGCYRSVLPVYMEGDGISVSVLWALITSSFGYVKCSYYFSWSVNQIISVSQQPPAAELQNRSSNKATSLQISTSRTTTPNKQEEPWVERPWCSRALSLLFQHNINFKIKQISTLIYYLLDKRAMHRYNLFSWR